MFLNNKNITSIAFSPSFNTENITDFGSFFSYCTKLESIDLSYLNFRNTEYLAHTFSFLQSLKTIDLSNIYAEKLIRMTSIFYGSKSLI